MKSFHFFITPSDIKGNEIIITGELSHKIKNVLRYKKGDTLTLIISPFKEYQGEIINISTEQITIKINSLKEALRPTILTTLYLSLIKSKNFELAIQKATELGVNRIVPFAAERSVVKIEKCNEFNKQNRWQSIATEAASQCKRGDIPSITCVVSMSDLQMIDDPSEVKIICDERGGILLKEYLKEIKSPLSISAVVGPEGGFTMEETDYFNKLGFTSVLLGRNILRSETVPLFLMSVFQYEFCYTL